MKKSMKKTVLVLIMGIVLLAVFGPDAKAQVPKEGTISETCSYSGTAKALPMGQERLQITYESMGVSLSDTGKGILHNASFRCLGAFHAVKGEYNDGSTSCVMIRPDGDQVFLTMKSYGKLGGGSKGTLTIVGGTGKLVGIQGSAEITTVDLRPAAEGTFQGYNKWKGQYNLP
jgi:hypothetical protein